MIEGSLLLCATPLGCKGWFSRQRFSRVTCRALDVLHLLCSAPVLAKASLVLGQLASMPRISQQASKRSHPYWPSGANPWVQMLGVSVTPGCFGTACWVGGPIGACTQAETHRGGRCLHGME